MFSFGIILAPLGRFVPTQRQLDFEGSQILPLSYKINTRSPQRDPKGYPERRLEKYIYGWILDAEVGGLQKEQKCISHYCYNLKISLDHESNESSMAKVIPNQPKSERRAAKGWNSMIWGCFLMCPFIVFLESANGRPQIHQSVNVLRLNPKRSYLLVGLAECAVLPER